VETKGSGRHRETSSDLETGARREAMAEASPATGWDEHQRQQLRARLQLSYRQRLDWLWQAKLFAERAGLAAIERQTMATKGRDER
jgi:hypothetical protein